MEAVGQLTGGVAHDFNNLLTVISGNLDLIEARAKSEEVRRLARSAQQGAARGARLVASLLAFARKQPQHPEIVNPNWLIKEFAPVLRGAAGDGVQLQLLLSPMLHPCRVDPAQFQSAILNLVTNACAAMPAGGRIAIETENVEFDSGSVSDLNPGSYVRISLSDTGTGMPPEVAAHAFEPFFTTKEVGKGSGLGLSQVYGFAKQSGGHADLSSEPGIGTTVRVYLPRSSEIAAVAARPEAVPEPAAPGSLARVMVVDDDPEVRAVFVQNLAALGYRVIEAGDGRQALRLIETGERVDLVLTDYLMPNGMTGHDLARKIAALDPGIRLILVSGNVSAAAADADELPILQKPIRQAELGRAIRQALQR